MVRLINIINIDIKIINTIKIYLYVYFSLLILILFIFNININIINNFLNKILVANCINKVAFKSNSQTIFLIIRNANLKFNTN